MRVIPVLDVKGGQVVRGVGGRREEYRPLVSRLADSSDPVAVARTFQSQLLLNELYLADLDAIAGSHPAVETYAAIHDLGCRLWVDAGIRSPGMAEPLSRCGVDRIVVGLETVAGPAVLQRLCQDFGERLVFSLDLKAGKPLGDVALWDEPESWAIAAQAVACGVGRMIILDLARVGISDGTGTAELCAGVAAAHPEIEVIAGGGVRDFNDLIALRQRGVRAALVASALHDGRLGRRDLERLPH